LRFLRGIPVSESWLASLLFLDGFPFSASLWRYRRLCVVLMQMRTDINAKTPLFQAHGMRDGVVRFEHGKKSSDALKKLGMDVEFHQYETMAHEANPKEIKQLGEWIKDRLGAGEEVVKGESETATAMGPAGPAVDDVD
jgi:acetyl esterase/lipase